MNIWYEYIRERIYGMNISMNVTKQRQTADMKKISMRKLKTQNQLNVKGFFLLPLAFLFFSFQKALKKSKNDLLDATAYTDCTRKIERLPKQTRPIEKSR